MPLYSQPKEGSVLMCDFNGFIEPEMIKRRPVVVIARNRLNAKLVTVVPISTTEPYALQAYHHELSVNPLPDKQGVRCWVKADMVATVSTERMDRIKIRASAGRQYITPVISAVDLQAIRRCVLHALQLKNTILDNMQQLAA
jgi:uncharacterized protein YifN (PemK superfamily)